MQKYIALIILMFVVWAIWATLSTGDLYELKQINPTYSHPNKNVAYLASKLNYSQSNGLWDRYHVESCSMYMPNWSKTRTCFNVRIACEYQSPIEKDVFGEKRDIFSDEFKNCWIENRPTLGLNEWLNISREVWRVLIFGGSIWIMGGVHNEGEKAIEWDKKNKWWAEPMFNWVEKGE